MLRLCFHLNKHLSVTQDHFYSYFTDRETECLKGIHFNKGQAEIYR